MCVNKILSTNPLASLLHAGNLGLDSIFALYQLVSTMTMAGAYSMTFMLAVLADAGLLWLCHKF